MKSAWSHRLACLLLLPALQTPSPASAGEGWDEGSNVVTTLSAPPPAGFLRAESPRVFSFPQDHGPHEGFQTEWWYLTGNLRDKEGRRFGYELTIFRTQLSPKAAPRKSNWAANQVFMADLAITDPDGRRFDSKERFSRGALGLAGAEKGKIWLEDWSVEGQGPNFPSQAHAAEDDLLIDFQFKAQRPVVLNGDGGLSRKADGPGDASYYYSIPRLSTKGRLSIGGKTYDVAGTSWLDREWSTSALSHDQAGWDWFALHLDDGRDLMFYRLRRKDGSTDPHSAGTLIDAKGRGRALSAKDVQLEPVGKWNAYPAKWRVRVPSEDISLELTPWLPDQELRHAFRYWEGAVSGPHAEGYVEMTGYGAASE